MAGIKRRGLRIVLTILIIAGVITFWVLRPIRDTDFATPGFTPLRDDASAARFAPVIIGHKLYGAPTRLFYRMARNSDGEIHIAYHPFYADEENPHAGFGAFMSRILYTGGLHLKDMMFGPADIELIEVILDAAGKPRLLAYEDTENYQPKNFGVKHVPKTVKNPEPLFCFETPTWNHMFSLAQNPETCRGLLALKPEYFLAADWEKYKMVKKTEAILRRNRMHRIYERQAAN
jgi:hypothetical protein